MTRQERFEWIANNYHPLMDPPPQVRQREIWGWVSDLCQTIIELEKRISELEKDV
jgi:hypothetical protein